MNFEQMESPLLPQGLLARGGRPAASFSDR